jgi:hypothetical protein
MWACPMQACISLLNMFCLDELCRCGGGGGFPCCGGICLLMQICLSQQCLSLHSLRFSSLFVQSAYALVDFLNVSVLEQAAFARMSAFSFPLMPLCTGIHATIILHSSFSSSHLSISLPDPLSRGQGNFVCIHNDCRIVYVEI